MRDERTAYRVAVSTAVGTVVFMLWAIGALGIIGVEGDPADLMYLGVAAVAIAGSYVARLRAAGMVRAMAATAGAVVVVGLIAIAAGEHRAPETSVLEIAGLTAMFAGLFAASAWSFRSASRLQARSS